MSRLDNDARKLLASIPIPLFLVDRNLCIHGMTPLAERILAGTSLPSTDLRMLFGPSLERVVGAVIDDHEPQQLELQDRNARWQSLRIEPYRTSTNQFDGAVLALMDLDPLREAHNDTTAAKEFAVSVIETGRTPLLVLRDDFEIRIANRAFYEAFGGQPEDTQNQDFFRFRSKQWDLPGLKDAVEKTQANRIESTELELEATFPGNDLKSLCFNIRVVHPADRKRILISIEDITARKLAQKIVLNEQKRLQSNMEASAAELKEANQILQVAISGREQVKSALLESEAALLLSREELRHLSASLMNAQDAERRRVSRELHDDLSQKVAKLQFDVETLQQKVPFEDIEDAKARLRNVVKQTASLSNDLRRVAHQLHPATLDHLGLSVAIRSYTEEYSRSTAIRVKFTGIQVPREIPIEVASGLYRIVQEALRNVGKHSSDSEVEVVLAKTPKGLALFVRDNGEGFDMESVRAKGGLGLVGMQERVRLLDGKFLLETRPGQGVLITVLCPLSGSKP